MPTAKEQQDSVILPEKIQRQCELLAREAKQLEKQCGKVGEQLMKDFRLAAAALPPQPDGRSLTIGIETTDGIPCCKLSIIEESPGGQPILLSIEEDDDESHEWDTTIDESFLRDNLTAEAMALVMEFHPRLNGLRRERNRAAKICRALRVASRRISSAIAAYD